MLDDLLGEDIGEIRHPVVDEPRKDRIGRWIILGVGFIVVLASHATRKPQDEDENGDSRASATHLDRAPENENYREIKWWKLQRITIAFENLLWYV